MNEWPIDENFIDYTVGNPTRRHHQRPADYPQITAQVLAASDEQGGIENLSTGFHAIEFLLVGTARRSDAGPGQRPYTDYVDGGTAANQDRRRTYLQVATSCCSTTCSALDVAVGPRPIRRATARSWSPARRTTALTKILRGFSQMAISELFYERLDDPFVTHDRKDEESCFSENTLVDLDRPTRSASRTSTSGAIRRCRARRSSDLVKAQDPALDAQMRQQLAAVRAAIDAIPPPFDHAVLAPAGVDRAPGRCRRRSTPSCRCSDTLDQVGDGARHRRSTCERARCGARRARAALAALRRRGRRSIRARRCSAATAPSSTTATRRSPIPRAT